MKTNWTLRFMAIFIAGMIVGEESLCAFSLGSFFKRYEKKKPVDLIKDLEDQLIDDPKNPEINYNLGVAQYQLNHFNDAKHNFERAALYGDKPAFKEQAYFNFATCLYKNTLNMLPQNWKKSDQEIDANVLENAIAEVSNAIKQYESVLLINEKNEKATTNKKEAEKLLQKLLEKKKQQEQKDQDKKDQQNDKDNKDQKDQDKDNQKNNKDEQKNNDQDQKSQDNQDSSEKDQKSQEQGKQEQQEQDKKKSSENDDAQSQNNDQKDKPEQRGKKEPASDQDERKEPGREHPEQKDEPEQEKNDVDHNKHNEKKEEQTKPTPAQPTHTEDEKQENEAAGSENAGFADQEDSTEKRAYRAILDNLDTDESKLQKNLIMQKAKGQRPPVGSMQKPW